MPRLFTILALAAPAARALVVGRTAPLRAMDVRMTTLPDGAPVVVVGGGAIQVLSARVAALRGHPTSIACIPSQVEVRCHHVALGLLPSLLIRRSEVELAMRADSEGSSVR